MGKMMRRISDHLKVLLTIALAVGLVLSTHARMESHDHMELAQIFAQYQTEIQEHGHAHEDLADRMQAYHDHAHEFTDHDHNIAFLPPRVATGLAHLDLSKWVLAQAMMADRRDFGLDRPPRV